MELWSREDRAWAWHGDSLEQWEEEGVCCAEANTRLSSLLFSLRTAGPGDHGSSSLHFETITYGTDWKLSPALPIS